MGAAPVEGRPSAASWSVVPVAASIKVCVDHRDGLVLIDAGLPGHLPQLRGHLARSNRSVSDVRAVLLTHGHPDHTGLARPLHQAGAEIRIQRQGAPILKHGPRSATRQAGALHAAPYLLRGPAAMVTALHLARKRAFTAPAVPGVCTFSADQRLEEVPGSPRWSPCGQFLGATRVRRRSRPARPYPASARRPWRQLSPGLLPADQGHHWKGVVLPEPAGGLLRVGGDSRSDIEELHEALLGVVRWPAGVAVSRECRPRGANVLGQRLCLRGGAFADQHGG